MPGREDASSAAGVAASWHRRSITTPRALNSSTALPVPRRAWARRSVSGRAQRTRAPCSSFSVASSERDTSSKLTCSWPRMPASWQRCQLRKSGASSSRGWIQGLVR